MDSETLILSPEEEIIVPSQETEVLSLINSNLLESGEGDAITPTFQPEGNEETNLQIPDAIDIVGSGSDSGAPLESAPSPQDENGRLQGGAEEEPETNSNISESLKKIEQILDERLPNRSETETENEPALTSTSESEVTLNDLKESIDKLVQYESELSYSVSTIENNQVISSNNDSVYNSYMLSTLMAIWGGFIIFLLFRKIG